MKEKSCVTV